MSTKWASETSAEASLYEEVQEWKALAKNNEWLAQSMWERYSHVLDLLGYFLGLADGTEEERRLSDQEKAIVAAATKHFDQWMEAKDSPDPIEAINVFPLDKKSLY